MSSPPIDAADRVQHVVSTIESDSQQYSLTSEKLRAEINALRQSDSAEGKLHTASFRTDLAQVSEQLHRDGVLPKLDIVDTKNDEVAFRGISTPGKSPIDGSPSLVTKADGVVYTYDHDNHVVSWSKGGQTWKYNSTDGEFHQFVHGKDTGQTNADVITVGANGAETATHANGSSTTTAAWGGTIERNADGLMTKETNNKAVKTFQYDHGQLTKMVIDDEEGKRKIEYKRDANGKFYASSDKDHQNPLDIAIDSKRDGVVHLTNKDGATTDEEWGATSVHWDKDHQVTSIDYQNGNKATNFSFDQSGHMIGFSMVGKDGKNQVYQAKDGLLSIDGEPAREGGLEISQTGVIKVTQTGDGSDQQYKSIQFGLGGNKTTSAKFGDKTLPTEVISSGGKVSRFEYDSSGDLTAVQGHGFDLRKQGNGWVGADGKPSDLNPSVNSNGSFSVIRPDGTYDTWTAGGTKTESIPDTPEAISKEAKEMELAEKRFADDANPGKTDSNSTENPSPHDSVSASGTRNKSLAAEIVRDARYVAEQMDVAGLCLKGVATALDMAHAGNIHGGSAWMAADRLARDNHFKEVPKDTKLQPGDIVVHGRTAQNPYGHILVYLGNNQEASSRIGSLTSMDYGQWTRVFSPI